MNTNATLRKSNCKFAAADAPGVATAKIMTLLLVGGFGACGNVLIIILAICYTARKNLHHLIISMAISDTIVIATFFLTSLPVFFGHNFWSKANGVSGNIACKLIMFLYNASSLVSLVTLLIASIERYKVTTTIQIIRPYSLKRRCWTVLSSWLVSAVLSSYILYYQEINNSQCHDQLVWTNMSGIFFLLMFTFAIISYIVIFTMSTLTLRRLSKPLPIEAQLSNSQRKVRKKRIASAAKMVLCSLLLYSSCYLPLTFFLVISIILSANGYTLADYNHGTCIDWSGLVFFIFNFLPLFNSSFSPCVHVALLPDFRKAAKKLIFEKGNDNRQVSPHSIVFRQTLQTTRF